MKRMFIMMVVLAAAAASSCQKYPSRVDEDGEYLVYTSHDQEVDFKNFNTFTVADSLLVIEPGAPGRKVSNSFSKSMVAEFKALMEDRGYSHVPFEEKSSAQLGIQLSYVSDTREVIAWQDPYWWLDYPGYWSPGYWGGWGGWYYPYPVKYTFMAHSVMADMADLTASGPDNKLPVIWNGMVNGFSSGSAAQDELRFRQGVRQAFAQSPYLNK